MGHCCSSTTSVRALPPSPVTTSPVVVPVSPVPAAPVAEQPTPVTPTETGAASPAQGLGQSLPRYVQRLKQQLGSGGFPEGCQVTEDGDEDYGRYGWHVDLTGTLKGTVYAGLNLCCKIRFASDHPFQPPMVMFQRITVHWAIDKGSGKPALKVLQKRNWGPAVTPQSLVQTLVDLLHCPNPDDPKGTELAEQAYPGAVRRYREGPEVFREVVEAYYNLEPPCLEAPLGWSSQGQLLEVAGEGLGYGTELRFRVSFTPPGGHAHPCVMLSRSRLGAVDSASWGLFAPGEDFTIKLLPNSYHGCLVGDGRSDSFLLAKVRVRVVGGSGTEVSELSEEWQVLSRGVRRLDSVVPTGCLGQLGGALAPHWGITLLQIRDLLIEEGLLDQFGSKPAGVTDMCVRDFVARAVVPRTRGKNMGYALMVNQAHPLEVRVMVSHSWEEGIIEFYVALSAILGPSLLEAPLFVCFFSIYQNDDPSLGVTIAQQLGSDPSKGPFVQVLDNFKRNRALRLQPSDGDVAGQRFMAFRAMEGLERHEAFVQQHGVKAALRSTFLEVERLRTMEKRNDGQLLKELEREIMAAASEDEALERLRCPYSRFGCGHMVVVPTQHCNLYTRMWCCLELFVAARWSVPIVLARNSAGILDASVSSEAARCGHPSSPVNADEKAIRAYIEGSFGYQVIDSFIEDFTRFLTVGPKLGT